MNKNLKKIPFPELISSIKIYQSENSYNKVLDVFIKIFLRLKQPNPAFRISEEVLKIATPTKTVSFIKLYRDKKRHVSLMVLVHFCKKYDTHTAMDNNDINFWRSNYSLANNSFNDRLIVQILKSCFSDCQQYRSRVEFLKTIPKYDLGRYATVLRKSHLKDQYMRGFKALKDLAVLRNDNVVQTLERSLVSFMDAPSRLGEQESGGSVGVVAGGDDNVSRCTLGSNFSFEFDLGCEGF